VQPTTEPSLKPSANHSLAPADDRRGHPRFHLTLAITMMGDNNFYTGLTEDISEGGIFIATYHSLPIWTPVVLSFTLPNSQRMLSVHGQVKWLRDHSATVNQGVNFGTDMSPVKPGMGIQFTDVDEEAMCAVRWFLRCRTPDFFD
jgi:uncharacterized protein (TIGR02266 family)